MPFRLEYPLVSGRLLVNGNDFYVGNSSSQKVQIARADQIPQVTQYVHPTTKQCNYTYTHPTEKQCNWAPSSTSFYTKLRTFSFTLNWSHKEHDSASAIGQQFDISSYIQNYSQFKLVCTKCSYGSILSRSDYSSDVVLGLWYSFSSDTLDKYGQTYDYQLTDSKSFPHNQTSSNSSFNITSEYKTIQGQLPWQKIAGSLVKCVDINSYGGLTYKVFDNPKLSLYIGSTSSNAIEWTGGTNVQISVDLYGLII